MKKAFQLYNDWKEPFDALEDEAAGRLIKAIFAHEHGENPIPDKDLKMPFTFIRQQLDRDRVKYEEKCEKNKAIALMRWGHTDAYERMQTDTDTDTGIDTDTDTYTDTDTDSISYESKNNVTISFSEYKKHYGDSKEPDAIKAMQNFITCIFGCLMMEHKRMTVKEWDTATDQILDKYQSVGNGIENTGKYNEAEFEKILGCYFKKDFDDYSLPHFNSKDIKASLYDEAVQAR